MKIRPGIELGNLTDVGCHRTNNEDYYCYAEPDDDEEYRKRGRLVVVADGMGGHEGGQIASGLAVEMVRSAYFRNEPADAHDALVAAFQDAHSAIQNHAEEHPELQGMGTTCTAAALLDGHLIYGHVGDSRLYLLRNNEFSQVTRDHSYVQRLIDTGMLRAEEAKDHPDKNVLTSALGADTVQADFAEQPMPLQAGDTLLLCTDGLHGLVSDEEMRAAAGGLAPSEACRSLVEMAKSRGGFDNITVQIVRVEKGVEGASGNPAGAEELRPI
jgi:serine/threonine protein phosphatase PrpC